MLLAVMALLRQTPITSKIVKKPRFINQIQKVVDRLLNVRDCDRTNLAFLEKLS